MINGLPGNMASLIEEAISKQSNYQIVIASLTGYETGDWYESHRSGGIKLYEPPEHQAILEEASLQWGESGLIAIDFTQPTAIEENVNLYCKNKIPFITGTTGGNRQLLTKLVEESEISAVIAPNMSVPIVMLMDMIAFAATNYPNALKDWEIRIVESHQSSKADVSGTALAIGEIIKDLGVNYSPSNIRDVRDKIEQRLMGIPEFALDGHGWHKYSLISPDGNEMIGFEHNINGRDTYVNGTLMALDFLTKKVAEGAKGKCFSMKDVMRG
ncbi:MAG: dihydrodipicolinate reductase C-terminal domain-containing protein [Candidatus Moraniibacteriota bacterium]